MINKALWVGDTCPICLRYPLGRNMEEDVLQCAACGTKYHIDFKQLFGADFPEEVSKVFISKVAFGKTINLGNYESARVDYEVTLNEGDNAELAFQEVRELVHNAELSIRTGRK